MDNLHVRQKFDRGKENKIYHHSSKEHLKITKIDAHSTPYRLQLNILHHLFSFVLSALVRHISNAS